MNKIFLLFLYFSTLAVFPANPEPEICAICQDSIKDELVTGEEVFSCSPEHKFHFTCLGNWCEHRGEEHRAPSCPMCRAGASEDEGLEAEMDWSDLETSSSDYVGSEEYNSADGESADARAAEIDELREQLEVERRIQELDRLQEEVDVLRNFLPVDRDLQNDPFLRHLANPPRREPAGLVQGRLVEEVAPGIFEEQSEEFEDPGMQELSLDDEYYDAWRARISEMARRHDRL
jgi:hypothetical protein